MSQTELVIGIESDFSRVLDLLSSREFHCNRRLRDKTKRIAQLLEKIKIARRDLEEKS